LRQRDIDSLMAFEMKYYRRILHIHWHQQIMNLDIRKRLYIKKNVVQLMMERNDNRLVKNVGFRNMDGQNRKERLSREWIDDIKEWCWVDELSLRHWTPRAQIHVMKKKIWLNACCASNKLTSTEGNQWDFIKTCFFDSTMAFAIQQTCSAMICHWCNVM